MDKITSLTSSFVYLVEMETGNGNSHHFHTTDTDNYTYGSSDVFYAKHTAQRRICVTVGVNGLIRDYVVVRRRSLL